MSSNIINVSLGEYGYEGDINLPVWGEFLTDLNGIYNLDIDEHVENGKCIISNEHIAACQYAAEHQKDIQHAILNELYVNYKKMQSDYCYDDEDEAELMPDVDNFEDFKDLIGLARVHIMGEHKDSIAYTGYEFACTWDEEHGFGVMMHKDRVIESGLAEISFLPWIAEKDLQG